METFRKEPAAAHPREHLHKHKGVSMAPFGGEATGEARKTAKMDFYLTKWRQDPWKWRLSKRWHTQPWHAKLSTALFELFLVQVFFLLDFVCSAVASQHKGCGFHSLVQDHSLWILHIPHVSPSWAILKCFIGVNVATGGCLPLCEPVINLFWVWLRLPPKIAGIGSITPVTSEKCFLLCSVWHKKAGWQPRDLLLHQLALGRLVN